MCWDEASYALDGAEFQTMEPNSKPALALTLCQQTQIKLHQDRLHISLTACCPPLGNTPLSGGRINIGTTHLVMRRTRLAAWLPLFPYLHQCPQAYDQTDVMRPCCCLAPLWS